jgi:hypothetical protein
MKSDLYGPSGLLSTIGSNSFASTNFFGRPRAGFAPPSTDNLGGNMAGGDFPAGAKGKAVIGEGIFDDSREGVVDVINATSNTVVGHIVLGPIANTGFNIARGPFVNTTPDDVPRTIFADGATDGTQPQPTGAYPNMLQSIVLFGDRGFVPNSAASPEPPLRLNGNVQSLLSVFDTASGQEIADQTFNLNRGINFDLPAGLLDAQIRDNTERMFPSVPVDIDCSKVEQVLIDPRANAFNPGPTGAHTRGGPEPRLGPTGEKRTFHSLRHTFAMRLLARGVGMKAIGDVLGHHSFYGGGGSVGGPLINRRVQAIAVYVRR